MALLLIKPSSVSMFHTTGFTYLRDRSLIIVRGGSCILQWSKGVGLAFFLEKKGVRFFKYYF